MRGGGRGHSCSNVGKNVGGTAGIALELWLECRGFYTTTSGDVLNRHHSASHSVA